MENLTFTAQVREAGVKANQLRKRNLIPAEYYGRGILNKNLQVDYQEFRKLYKKAGYNTVIELKFGDQGEAQANEIANVLIHEVHRHPVNDRYTHVEFINVRMDEAVNTTIPIRLEGVAPAVRDLEGVLVQSLDKLSISCLPADLLHEVVLNVEPLVDFNKSLHVSDIKLSDRIKILTPPETAVASVTPPLVEEVAPVEAEVTPAEVEITTEKKAGEAEAKPEAGTEAPKEEGKKEKKVE